MITTHNCVTESLAIDSNDDIARENDDSVGRFFTDRNNASVFMLRWTNSENECMLTDREQDGVPTELGRVLVVDDEPAVAEVAAAYIERRLADVDVETETSPEAALDRLATGPEIDCLVSDYLMPELDGYELYDRVRERRPDLPFILFTAVPRSELDRPPAETDVNAYVEKNGSTQTFDSLATEVRKEAI